MSRAVADLESVLANLIVEHRKLLKLMEAQQGAMRHFKLELMEEITVQQEKIRLRLASLDNQRKAIVLQVVKQNRIEGDITLTRLAELYPPRKEALLKLKDELRKVIAQVQHRTTVAGRLAGAVLGHLNTVVRLVAGAVERAGVYTKHGTPQVSRRIGVMEAVG
jgi:hypothetical protein